jgi:hypothetical protein
MLLIDNLLFGGLRFVLDKLATVADQELNDESRLHERLMEAQMRFEIGEISAEEFAGIERTVIDRLREIRAEREAGAPALTDEGVRISNIEIAGPDADVEIEMPAAARVIDSPEAPPVTRGTAGRGTPRPRRTRSASTKPQPTGRRRTRH